MKMLLSKYKRKFFAVFSILLLSFVQLTESLVVPPELVSILSLVYSNIPPIKKGTDSRIGFGYRLGDNADFQVMFELGPQKETRPIGDKDASDSSFNKRHISKAQQNAVLRKQQLQLLQQQQQQQSQELTSTERTASNWLQNWSEDMNTNNKKRVKSKQQHATIRKQQQKTQYVSNQQQREAQQQQLPTMPVVAEQSLRQLQQLYQMATSTGTTSASSTTTSTTTTTAAPTKLMQILRATPAPFQGGSLNLGGPAGFTRSEDSMLQSIVEPRSPKKSKSEITKELMNVSLEADE